MLKKTLILLTLSTNLIFSRFYLSLGSSYETMLSYFKGNDTLHTEDRIYPTGQNFIHFKRKNARISSFNYDADAYFLIADKIGLGIGGSYIESFEKDTDRNLQLRHKYYNKTKKEYKYIPLDAYILAKAKLSKKRFGIIFGLGTTYNYQFEVSTKFESKYFLDIYKENYITKYKNNYGLVGLCSFQFLVFKHLGVSIFSKFRSNTFKSKHSKITHISLNSDDIMDRYKKSDLEQLHTDEITSSDNSYYTKTYGNFDADKPLVVHSHSINMQTINVGLRIILRI